jgi:hypothetical protein
MLYFVLTYEKFKQLVDEEALLWHQNGDTPDTLSVEDIKHDLSQSYSDSDRHVSALEQVEEKGIYTDLITDSEDLAEDIRRTYGDDFTTVKSLDDYAEAIHAALTVLCNE